MKKEALPVIITGHVDHGKSTLIGRLLFETGSLPKEKIAEIRKISKELGKDTEMAYLTDQLREERERDMTIDTTQIFFKKGTRNYVIIDSPGHLELIKNMVTGATLAETAVLIVDAAEGIMEQTRRHAYILSMLGISNLIVACNKMDLVGYQKERFEEIRVSLLKFLRGLKISPPLIIPVSAKEGANISQKSPCLKWYKGPTLLSALGSLSPVKKTPKLPLRFPVQDVYEIGARKIIAGRIAAGTVRRNGEIKILPSLAGVKVASIEIFGKSPQSASSGESIGITLDKPLEVKRGDVIVDTKATAPLSCFFKGDIFWMADEPLKINLPFRLRLATQETDCIVEKIEKRINSSTLEIIEEDAKELKLNESGVALFKAARPLVAEKFSLIAELGRFVIERDFKLLGAGIIT